MRNLALYRDILQVRTEHNYIRTVANGLAKAKTREQMAQIVMDVSCEALKSSAACLYILQPDGYYEMIAQKGCTLRFQTELKRIPGDFLPLVNTSCSHETIFFGSAEEFKAEVPSSEDLVNHSSRNTIAYVPLIANNIPIGIFGFAYNQPQSSFKQKEFVLTLADLFALAFERDRLFDQESAARKEAEHANRAKTEFLANISHEIRTPVGVIQGFADLLFKSQGLTDQQQRWAGTIRKNAIHLGALIGDVLDIAKIEGEKVVVTPRAFLISNLIEDVYSVLSSKAEEFGVQLNIVSPNENIEVTADRGHIRQVLVSLIDNAIKFSEQSEVCVEIFYQNGNFNAKVTDFGCGIPEEHHTHIFESFAQVDGASSRAFGGAGLGLSISRRLSRAMGGDLILLNSRPGEGSTFLLKFPCPATINSQGQNPNLDFSPKYILDGLNVLIVDDSADNRDLISHILGVEGAKVEVGTNGEEGVHMALESKYDVVLMDIQMPKLDGFQAVEILRSKGYSGSVAALTARALSTDVEESTQRGFNEYLTKPIDQSQLILTVKRLAEVDSKRLDKAD